MKDTNAITLLTKFIIQYLKKKKEEKKKRQLQLSCCSNSSNNNDAIYMTNKKGNDIN